MWRQASAAQQFARVPNEEGSAGILRESTRRREFKHLTVAKRSAAHPAGSRKVRKGCVSLEGQRELLGTAVVAAGGTCGQWRGPRYLQRRAGLGPAAIGQPVMGRLRVEKGDRDGNSEVYVRNKVGKGKRAGGSGAFERETPIRL